MALARKPFVVLDAEILSSSVWSEKSYVRLVWITLLILCDTEGYVGASVPGIASAAGVTLEEAEAAIGRLKEPDPYSRTKANDGRRIEVVDRGFRILNFTEHLDRLSSERARSRERVRRWRNKKRASVTGNVTNRAGSSDKGPEISNKGQETKEGTNGRPANPLIQGKRTDYERESLTLTSRIAELTGEDPVEVFAQAAHYEGALRQKVNPAGLSDDRLLNTVIDLRKTLKNLQTRERRA